MQNVLILRIIFGLLAAIIAVFSIMAVSTKRILHAATYLLFVLFATAGLYFFLNYSFLGAVQLLVYAGGVIILYVFSILLTNTDRETALPIFSLRRWLALLATVGGVALVGFLLLTHTWAPTDLPMDTEISMKTIGHALMGTGKGQYLLPFEMMSLLLLACMVGALVIARKRS